jgi:predicted amidophosphoribosyltransferase
MAVRIHPKTLQGPWTQGFALDVHTTRSTFLGHNEYGREVYDTERSQIGELLYRLKYRGDREALREIVDTAAGFLMGVWKLQADILVPVPPSNTARKNQPVMEVAASLSDRCHIPLRAACVTKVRNTAQLKNVFELAKRTELLRDAFAVDRDVAAGQRILVFDDLYRSGATAGTISRLLTSEGGAEAVYLLTLTQTRRSL